MPPRFSQFASSVQTETAFDVLAVAKQLKAAGKDVIELEIGDSPFPTSPAAAELEERMMQWLRKMLGLPPDFTGVIQDTASSATLCSILTARERQSDFTINKQGLFGSPPMAVYASEETHSSIEKDVKIAGLGSNNIAR